jgi:hypothetical protein
MEPAGTLEEVLVEKIAQEYWRLGVAAWHEGEAFHKDNPFDKPSNPENPSGPDADQPSALSSHEPTREIAAASQRRQRPSAAEPAGLG